VITPDTFGRIAKLLVDRDGASPEEVRERLARHRVALICGPEVVHSPTLQAAVLSAANIANRCFPGCVSLHLPGSHGRVRIRVPWSSPCYLDEAVSQVIRRQLILTEKMPPEGARILFGSCDASTQGIQVTFDGWVAAVAPTIFGLRMPEREYCVLAGVVGGALAVGEIFFDWAGVSVGATRRRVGLSLWRPDLTWNAAAAVGPPVEFLPGEFWCLGLGHLGQAFLWCLGLLPFSDPAAVKILLNDFDTIIPANVDTGLLTCQDDQDRLKTRIAAKWMEGLGFQTRLLERPFDEYTRRHHNEPALALCGFDGRGPRGSLDDGGFMHVLECGLGGSAEDFDVLEFHTLGHPSPPSSRLWPPTVPSQGASRAEELAINNPVYRGIQETAKCGHLELAGIAVAVPFMGAVAAGLVVAESLRMLHDGERYERIRMQLGLATPAQARLVPDGYRGRRNPRFGHQSVRRRAV
jgi:hypothetical protein